MKTISIRAWIYGVLAIYFVASVAPFVYIGSVVCAGANPSGGSPGLGALISQNVARWTDPAWQAQLRAALPGSSSVVLLDSAEHELYRYGRTPLDPTPAGYIQYVVMDGARTAGVARVYDVSPCGGLIYPTVAAPVSILAQLLVGSIIAWVLSRSVLRPLADMSQAARRIAGGELDFELAPSRFSEVADVTSAFRAMGDALRGAITRQADMEQERRFFISAIAHDLRTPLFALRGYLEGLGKGVASTPEKAAHYIQVSKEKADALERLIADLFAYSRLEYLEQTPHQSPMNFGELARQAVEDIRPQAETKQIALALQGDDCPVRGDRLLLGRALANLLDNALRYTPKGGSIRLSWERAGKEVRFTISDSGPGIDPADLPHIFEPLYRAEKSRHGTGDGSSGAGLGLTVAQRVLRAHGGDLRAANRENGGAEFSGQLPAK